MNYALYFVNLSCLGFNLWAGNYLMATICGFGVVAAILCISYDLEAK